MLKTDQSFSEPRQTIGFEDRLYGLETGFLNNHSKTNNSIIHRLLDFLIESHEIEGSYGSQIRNH